MSWSGWPGGMASWSLRTWHTVISASAPRRRPACGRSRPTWCCRPARSLRSSSPGCGSAGHQDRQIVSSRALYARRAALTADALSAHMPDGTTWTQPQGGFYVWVTAPDGVDTVALSAAARARKVAYVPGCPFYPGDAGTTQIRLAYSRVADHLIDEGVRRIGEVLRTALEEK